MTTKTAGARETFLRERSARSLAIATRVFDPRLLYAGYLLSGIATLIVCLGTSPSVVAIGFVLYLVGLTAFVLFDRRRFNRTLADLESVSTEDGPQPDPAATRLLPRYLLTAKDAVDLPMLDSILVTAGDSLAAFRDLTKPMRRRARAYFLAGLWVFVGFILLVIAFVAGLTGQTRWQVALAEATLVLLALVPPYVAIREANRYSQFTRRINLLRMSEAEHMLTVVDAPERPFIDGAVVRYRNGRYIIDKQSMRPPVDDARVARERRRDRWNPSEIFPALAAAVSVAAFVVHPMSGILVQ